MNTDFILSPVFILSCTTAVFAGISLSYWFNSRDKAEQRKQDDLNDRFNRIRAAISSETDYLRNTLLSDIEDINRRIDGLDDHTFIRIREVEDRLDRQISELWNEHDSSNEKMYSYIDQQIAEVVRKNNEMQNKLIDDIINDLQNIEENNEPCCKVNKRK